MIIDTFCGITLSDWERAVLSAAILSDAPGSWEALPVDTVHRLKEAQSRLSKLPVVLARELALEELRCRA